MSKSYRIRTEIGVDKYINVKLEQDFDFLEILSLKINQSEIYIRPCSDYGVVVGRVSVNNGFGLPNAKVSVFIPLSLEDETNPIISEIYPYKTLSDVNEDGYRYNLLPKEPSYSVHAATGTFPTKEETLIEQTQVEIYDKYYKFTTRTNESGDYMIFGVPVGSQTVFMDVDLSDIGCFSLSPQDLIQSGLAVESQVNGSKFKTSTNLNELPQIVTSNRIIDVSPLWGEPDICSLGITRCDFDLTQSNNINIQPTAVFMGSIVSTTNDDALKTNCKPKNNTGNLCELIAGQGQIQAIRQTIFLDEQNLPILEEHQFEQNGNVIDGDGSYMINVPMNLDYVITNEFGEQVLSGDPSKGIPTKGKYRFKFKWKNEGGLQNQFLRANFLVPNIKEHGWSTSSSDPLNPNNTSQFTYTITPGLITGTTQTLPGGGGLVLEDTINTNNFQIYLNGVLYTGDPNVIPINGGTITIVANAVDPNTQQTFNFTYYQSDYFNLLRSYTFSLDWDDYVDTQSAINCDDTFYEFNYNKVYTTSMFLDRYKNGLGRAKHLGIKEIDNRSCKTTVNTFPVNDVIRNFDFIFFIFNILLSVLSPLILVLLYIAHFVSFTWPILKYVLIIVGLVLTYDAGVALYVATQTGIQTINTAIGAVTNAGLAFETIRLFLDVFVKIAQAAFQLALSIAFTGVAIALAIKVKGFPRIGLPMISYPECTSCDCNCGNAEMSDDFDSNSAQEQIDSYNEGNNTSLATSNSFLAPLNLSGTYSIDHPNLRNKPTFDDDDDNAGWFSNYLIPIIPPLIFETQYKSLFNRVVENEIDVEVAAQASIDFRRIFSGWDDLDSPYFDGFKSPQPFLFAAEKRTGGDDRWYARPETATYPQKLNDFNTRDKYFTGVNRITTTVNPNLNSTPFNDSTIVIITKKGATQNLGIGNLITFQDPKTSNGQINLTGATTNQFGLNSITGTTISSQTPIPITINYANPSDPTQTGQLTSTVFIVQTGDTETYMQYLPDIEYFQVLTGMTIGDYETISESQLINPTYFHNEYLKHVISYSILNPLTNAFALPIPTTIPSTDSDGAQITLNANNFVAIEKIANYKTDYEVLILTRGVDAHTPKQTIQYDLSRIFGYSTPNTVTISGQYYMNVPIQPSINTAPRTHNTSDNSLSTGIYFKSYTFTPNQSDYTGFTSTNPYYYLSTEDVSMSGPTYQPTPVNSQPLSVFLNPPANITPLLNTLPPSDPKYIGSGTFIAINRPTIFPIDLKWSNANKSDTGWAFGNTTSFMFKLYSGAYYKYPTLTGVNFNNNDNIVMRSDRLPTSSCVENGPGDRTGYALHQNNNFCVFKSDGSTTNPTQGFASDLPSGEIFDTDLSSGLTSTLTCDSMIPLKCYAGSGNNVTVNPNCEIPTNRMVRGCYCLLNPEELNKDDDPFLFPLFKKIYLIKGAFINDVRLFLEWKTRFTITFAACRGVFAQTFQNNWINGVLYMFTFNKTAIYQGITDTTPDYKYCDDVIVFNDLENNFYYRSSPWDGNNFIGKNPPISNVPPILANGYPGLGYNTKQIQFPTTIMDLGPREQFISEICNNDNFNGYLIDQIKSTSYQDNSSLIQIGFLSRLLNENVRQAIIPVSNPAGDNTEGKGIIQFFNSNRQGDRIDGDFAQMLSINSEWRINPFLIENYPNPNSIFLGNDTQSNPRPVFGVFFEGDDNDFIYRRRLSPGFEYYNITPPLYYNYTYPKTQEVPHYRWKLEPQSNNIFGNENNNWDTNVTPNGGFFSKGYQDLDFNSDPYFKASHFGQTQRGYIVNFDNSNNPDETLNGTTPLGSSILVGAPYHFYFGLNNGKTAIDKFIKLYIFNPDA